MQIQGHPANTHIFRRVGEEEDSSHKQAQADYSLLIIQQNNKKVNALPELTSQVQHFATKKRHLLCLFL